MGIMMKNYFISGVVLAITLVSNAPVAATVDECTELINQKKYELAFPVCKKAADQGDAIASRNMSIMYGAGRGITRDHKESMKWLRKASEQANRVTQEDKEAVKRYRNAAHQGNAEAQHYLGIMYARGEGVTRDYKQAFKWLRKAAHQGNAEAQGALGMMYKDGLGVIQDYIMAHMWFNLAGSSSNTGAAKFTGIIAEKMTKAQIAEAQKLAREWKPKKP